MPHDSMGGRYQFACANASGSGKLNSVELLNWANTLSVTIQQKLFFDFDVVYSFSMKSQLLYLCFDAYFVLSILTKSDFH
jgi:hypothetical protein